MIAKINVNKLNYQFFKKYRDFSEKMKNKIQLNIIYKTKPKIGKPRKVENNRIEKGYPENNNLKKLVQLYSYQTEQTSKIKSLKMAKDKNSQEDTIILNLLQKQDVKMEHLVLSLLLIQPRPPMLRTNHLRCYTL